MWHFAVSSLALVALASPASALVQAGESRGSGRALRPSANSEVVADDGLVKPFHFDQRLLVCNAYPSDAPMVVRKNNKEMLADEGHAIAFRECRYVNGQLKSHDRLDMTLRGQEIHGTFEVEDNLPSSDAILLLVLEKHEGSSLVNFQSLAFPATGNNGEAQLAVIDPFQSAASIQRLHMEDHISGKEEQTVSKRVEELSFNRVYSIEAGVYDAFVETSGHGESEEVVAANATAVTKKMIRLAKSQNYVVLRTGSGEKGHFSESLVVFPDEMKSGSQHMFASWLVAAAVTLSLAVAV